MLHWYYVLLIAGLCYIIGCVQGFFLAKDDLPNEFQRMKEAHFDAKIKGDLVGTAHH